MKIDKEVYNIQHWRDGARGELLENSSAWTGRQSLALIQEVRGNQAQDKVRTEPRHGEEARRPPPRCRRSNKRRWGEVWRIFLTWRPGDCARGWGVMGRSVSGQPALPVLWHWLIHSFIQQIFIKHLFLARPWGYNSAQDTPCPHGKGEVGQ